MWPSTWWALGWMNHRLARGGAPIGVNNRAFGAHKKSSTEAVATQRSLGKVLVAAAPMLGTRATTVLSGTG
jgi:hypothetical protein